MERWQEVRLEFVRSKGQIIFVAMLAYIVGYVVLKVLRNVNYTFFIKLSYLSVMVSKISGF